MAIKDSKGRSWYKIALCDEAGEYLVCAKEGEGEDGWIATLDSTQWPRFGSNGSEPDDFDLEEPGVVDSFDPETWTWSLWEKFWPADEDEEDTYKEALDAILCDGWNVVVLQGGDEKQDAEAAKWLKENPSAKNVKRLEAMERRQEEKRGNGKA